MFACGGVYVSWLAIKADQKLSSIYVWSGHDEWTPLVLNALASIHWADGRLTAISREVSNSLDWML